MHAFRTVVRFFRYVFILLAALALCAYIGRPIWRCRDSDRQISLAELDDIARLNTGHNHSLSELEEGQWLALMPSAQPDLSTAWRGAYRLHEDSTEDSLSGSFFGLEPARRVAGWGWSGKGALAELDGEALVLRALASTGGIVLVGDKTHVELFEHLVRCLPPRIKFSHTYTPIDATRRTLPERLARDGMRTVLVHPSDYVTELLQRAGAPPERLSRPLLRFVRDDLLLTAARFGVLVARTTPDQLSDLVSQDWPGVLRDAVSPIKTDEGAWEGGSKTVLVLNSGARWAQSFHRSMKHRVLWGVYHAMVEDVIHVLSAFANSTHTLYRPSIPGHASCGRFTAPVRCLNRLEPLSSANHGWELLPGFNKQWVDRLHALHSSAHVGVKHNNKEKPPGYLPVYLRSLLRPDAHSNPSFETKCLYQAGPNVRDQWARWMLQEARYMDEGHSALQYST